MPASQQLKRVPTMRGWNGGPGKPWETVGTGRKVAAIKSWLHKGTLPHDWREKVSEGFITEMTSKTWAKYNCPECSASI
jgi:hypothetical protein